MSGMRRSHDISRPSLSPAFPRLGRCTAPRCCRPSACPSRHAPFAHLHTVVPSDPAHSTPPPLRLSQGIRSEPTLAAVSAIQLIAKQASESKAACRADEQTSRRADGKSPMSRSGMAPILTRRRPTFVLIVPRLQHLHTPLTAYTHKHTAVIAELPG
jgi:hypothetical protein